MSYDFKGKRVYLAGPMRGHDDLNFPAFDEAQRKVYDAGAAFVFNPARAWGHVDKPASWYMLHDLHRLTESDGGRPLFDAIVMLEGWHVSEGSSLEYQVARACGIELINLREVARGE